MKTSPIRIGLTRALDRFAEIDDFDLNAIIAAADEKLRQINPLFGLALDYPVGSILPEEVPVAELGEHSITAFALANTSFRVPDLWSGLMLSRGAVAVLIPAHHTSRVVTFEATERTPCRSILWNAEGAKEVVIDFIINAATAVFSQYVAVAPAPDRGR